MTDYTAPSPTVQPHRPVRLIALMVLLCGVQLGSVLRAGPAGAAGSVPPALDFVAGGLWAALAALTAWSLYWCRPHARLQAAWLVVGFVLYSLARLTVFVQSDYDRGRLPFLFVATIIILIIPVAHIARWASSK